MSEHVTNFAGDCIPACAACIKENQPKQANAGRPSNERLTKQRALLARARQMCIAWADRFKYANELPERRHDHSETIDQLFAWAAEIDDEINKSPVETPRCIHDRVVCEPCAQMAVRNHEQMLRAVREIGKCLERAAGGEGIQLAAARGKVADLTDWVSDLATRPAVEPTACLCNAPSLDCPVHPRPAEKASPLPIDREAANALALECAQASAVVRKREKREWIFDRYRNDRLMAQGVKVHAVSYAEAYAEAVSLLFIDSNKPTDELRLQQENGDGK